MKPKTPPGREVAAWLAAMLLAVPAGWGAEERSASASSTVHKTTQGLHFNVPPDWPIEERNGVVGPVPIEEYLASKFKAMQSQLQAMDQQLGGLDLRLRVVEEQLKERPKGMRSAEGTAKP